MTNHPNGPHLHDLKKLGTDLNDKLETLETATEVWVMDNEGTCLDVIKIEPRKPVTMEKRPSRSRIVGIN